MAVVLLLCSTRFAQLYCAEYAQCVTFGWPMAAFSNWMLLIHSPPDFTTSLLLQPSSKKAPSNSSF